MEKIALFLLLMTWLIVSLILACSVIGLLLFVRADHNCSTFQGDEGMSSWMRLGHGILKKF